MGHCKPHLRCTPIKHTECTNNHSMRKTSISLRRPTFLPILTQQLHLSKITNSNFKQETSKEEMWQHLEPFIIPAVMFRWPHTMPRNLTHTTGRICFSNSDLARMWIRVPCTVLCRTATHGRCPSMWKTRHHNNIYLRPPTMACNHTKLKCTTNLCTPPSTHLLMDTNSRFPLFFDLICTAARCYITKKEPHCNHSPQAHVHVLFVVCCNAVNHIGLFSCGKNQVSTPMGKMMTVRPTAAAMRGMPGRMRKSKSRIK